MDQRGRRGGSRSGSGGRSAASIRQAYSLVELLVLIVMLVLLWAVIVPSMAQARGWSRTVACQTNLRAVTAAATRYAQDNRDLLWPARGWAHAPLHAHADQPEAVASCPSEPIRNDAAAATMHPGLNYSMVLHAEGAMLGTQTRMAYLRAPERTTPEPELDTSDSLAVFSGLPVFVEESPYFHGAADPSRVWAGVDQFAQRHAGGSNLAMLEGHVEFFSPPHGEDPATAEREDLDASGIYAWGGRGIHWVRLEPDEPVLPGRSSAARYYGWINSPR